MSDSTGQLTRPAQTASYRPMVWGGRLGTLLDGRPAFTWQEAERMRFDPQVQLGLRILRAPLYGVTWKVQADNAKAEGWINRELKSIYQRMMPRLVRHFEYGVACGEVTYQCRKVGSKRRIHFADFFETHPQDTRPYLQTRGRNAGKLAAMQVKNVGGAVGSGATVYLDRRHSFWFKGEADFGDWWGRARLGGAYQPWFDKGSRHAANDAIRLFYRKQAFKGPVLYYPPGVTDVGTPETGPILKNNQDIARELVEKFQNGGVLAIPSILDDKGNPLWRWEDPKAFSDLTGLMDYKKMLDRDILIGLGIPPELVDAATVGSGYSGRAIPAQVFFSSMDEEAARIIQAIDEQILRWLVRLNFGAVGYSITPDSLASLVARDPSQAGVPAGQLGQNGQRVASPDGQPLRQEGPRGGHQIIDPQTGKVRYERQQKPRVRLSMAAGADHSVSWADARKLWDSSDGEMLVPMGAKW